MSGKDQIELISRLYPLNRYILSDDYNLALDIIMEQFPVAVFEYPSSEKSWTWTIPDKWTCLKGYIRDMKGNIIADINNNPLHVALFSSNYHGVVSRNDLLQHVFSHPHLHDAVPFIFYYYQDNWAFCLSGNCVQQLQDKEYEVVIESRREKGVLRIGEYFLQGKSNKTFVFCTHLDHPVQANDGLSGVVTSLAVMSELANMPHRNYSYLLLILPETIGSVTWLSHNENRIKNIFGGLFVEMTGLNIPPALQLSYNGNMLPDKIFRLIHNRTEDGAWTGNYRETIGNDERQFNAPGIRIPMLSYARCYKRENPHWPFAQYHSDKDNLDITNPEKLDRSKENILAMIRALESDYYPVNKFKGEVFLSGYGIAVDRNKNLNLHRNMLRIMDMIDGTNTLTDIAGKLDLDFTEVLDFTEKLYRNDLIGKNPLLE
jgi:aminopeptidase-like protein